MELLNKNGCMDECTREPSKSHKCKEIAGEGTPISL